MSMGEERARVAAALKAWRERHLRRGGRRGAPEEYSVPGPHLHQRLVQTAAVKRMRLCHGHCWSSPCSPLKNEKWVVGSRSLTLPSAFTRH